MDDDKTGIKLFAHEEKALLGDSMVDDDKDPLEIKLESDIKIEPEDIEEVTTEVNSDENSNPLDSITEVWIRDEENEPTTVGSKRSGTNLEHISTPSVKKQCIGSKAMSKKRQRKENKKRIIRQMEQELEHDHQLLRISKEEYDLISEKYKFEYEKLKLDIERLNVERKRIELEKERCRLEEEKCRLEMELYKRKLQK